MISSITQNERFQLLNQKYLNIIFNRWFNLINAILLVLMLVITIACFLADFYLHYQLLFLCRKALFSFLAVAISIIIAFCSFHLTRIVLMFKKRAEENMNKSRLAWFSNTDNYAEERDEDDDRENFDVDSEQEEEENEDPDKVLEKTYSVLEGKSDIMRAVIFAAQIIFIIISVGLFLALLLFTIIAVPRQQLTLPQYKGTLKIKANFDGSEKPIISRESNGMVHILAHSEYDAYFAQGVAHAQDRLFQLEFNKRVAAGTVSEISGSTTLDLDKVSRTIGFRRAAMNDLKHLSEHTLEAIQAYCDGINNYIKTNPNMPPTFGILKTRPTEWSPVDVLGTFKYISWTMSANHNREVVRHKLLQKGLTLQRIEELLPHYDPTKYPTILHNEDLHLNLTAKEIAEIEERKTDNSGYYNPLQNNGGTITNYTAEELKMFTAFEEYFGLQPFSALGSNNWVVSGNFTKNKKPLLANDPHLKLSAPGLWYLNHIQGGEELDVIGASLVGVPGVIIGRNKHISWGIANSYADAQDLYALQMDEDGRYIHNGVALELDTRTEEIKVKGGATVELTVSESIYGPVINDLYGIKDSAPLSLYWTALSFNDSTLESFHKLNFAKDHDEFTDALRAYVAPSQNFVYADVHGNIAYRLAGKIPQRKRGHSGRYAVPGTGKYDHDKDVSFEEMPSVVNPERGYIITANNRVAPPGYPYTTTQDFFRSWRAKRIQEIIEHNIHNNVTMTLDHMRDIQFDVKSYVFEDFRFVFQNMSFDDDSDMNSWRLRLVNWDAIEKVDTQETSLFEGWLQDVAHIVEPETGTVWKEPYFLHNLFANEDPACRKYYNITCAEYAKQSFKKVIMQFRQDYGKVPAWGIQAHTAHFSHQALDGTYLKCMVSRDILSPGGSGTINNAEIINDKLETREGVTYRQIIDMANNYETEGERRRVTNSDSTSSDSDKFIIPLGQSGNYFSPYYENLFDYWYNGEYIDMKMAHFSTKYKLVLNGQSYTESD